MSIEYNPEYIHHTDTGGTSRIRELVFGMEDGMVSTLGAITGIAAATHDLFTTVLAGLVVISVESISMGVGSYLSSKSVRAIDERKLEEERQELFDHPEEEKEELIEMYVRDGWTKKLAREMAKEASKNKDLFLQEMAYRELKIFPSEMEEPLRNGLVMGGSYILGGAVPITAYFIFPLYTAIVCSIVVTLIGLFLLGVYTTKFSKRVWWKAGLEMFALAGLAAAVGYVVGQVVNNVWL
jgi:vacuolar iron transporter family protein